MNKVNKCHSSSPHGVPTPWPKHFPDTANHGMVSTMLMISTGVVLMSVMQILVVTGTLGIGGVEPSPSLGIPLLLEAVVTSVAAVVMGWRRSAAAGFICAAFAAIGAILFYVSGCIRCALVKVGVLVLVLTALLALRKMRSVIEIEADRNPLVAHYRLLVRMLAQMMTVDRHVDKREAVVIAKVCDSLRISGSEQRRFLGEVFSEAEQSGGVDIAEMGQRYLDLAGKVGLPHPRRTAMMAALAVASADGIIGEEEERELKEMGRGLRMDESAVLSEIARHRAHLEELTPAAARQLLNLGPEATPIEVESAFMRVHDDLRIEDFEHLGDGLRDYAARRLEIIEKAHLLLIEELESMA